jgi:hypothetical protein
MAESQSFGDRLRDNWKWLVPTAVVLGIVGAWLAFGVFGIQTLFIDEEVEEAPPVFSSGAGASGLPSDEVSEDMTDEMNDVMTEEATPSVAEVDEPAAMEDSATVETLAEGDFVDRSHPTSGTAVVLGDGSGERFLRFEDFETDNGPDLNVYLSTALPDADAGDFDEDFIDLGDLKGNIGPQNYEIPLDADLDRYGTVVIWCVRFSVAFGAAPLTP